MKKIILVLSLVCISAPTALAQANTDLYVQCSTGTDGSPVYGALCPQSAPCASVQYALSGIQNMLRAKATIHVLALPDGGADTCYAPTTADPNTASIVIDGYTTGPNSSDQLIIDGQTKALQASTAATSTSTTGNVITINKTAAGWTAHAFQNAFVEVTSGSNQGTYAIIDNTTTAITAVGSVTLSATPTFDVIQPIVTVKDSLAATPNTAYTFWGAVEVLNSLTSQNQIGGSAALVPGITVQHLNLTSVSGTGYNPVSVFYSHGVAFQYNVFSGPSAAVYARGNQLLSLYANQYTSAGTAHFFEDGAGASNTDADTGNAIFQLNNFSSTTGPFALLQNGNFVSRQNNISISGAGNAFTAGGSSVGITQLADDGSSISCGGTAAFNTANGSAGVLARIWTYNATTVTGTCALANLSPGSQFKFASTVSVASTNFVSLDNTATWTSKATIEAATQRAVANSTFLTLAQEWQ